QATVCFPLNSAGAQKCGAIRSKFQHRTGHPGQSRSTPARPHKRPDQEMKIEKLPADVREQPFLLPISREDHVVASIGICCVEPCSIAAIGKMHACRLEVKNKLKAVAGKPICEFNILCAAKTLVETAGSKNVAPSKRGIARIELPRRRRPVSPQHGTVLLHEHLLLPTDPRSHHKALRCKQGPKHHDILPRRLVV